MSEPGIHRGGKWLQHSLPLCIKRSLSRAATIVTFTAPLVMLLTLHCAKSESQRPSTAQEKPRAAPSHSEVFPLQQEVVKSKEGSNIIACKTNSDCESWGACSKVTCTSNACSHYVNIHSSSCSTPTGPGQCFSIDCIDTKDWSEKCGEFYTEATVHTAPIIMGDQLSMARGNIEYARQIHKKFSLGLAKYLIRCLQYPGKERPYRVMWHWDGTDELDSTATPTPRRSAP